jgi:hypothetical protein
VGKVDNLYSLRYYHSHIPEHENILTSFKPYLNSNYFGHKEKTHQWGCDISTTIGMDQSSELPWDAVRPHILNGGHQIIKSFIPECKYTIEISALWANIYERYDFQEIHDHVNLNTHFSFAYILECDDLDTSSKFQFYNDCTFMKHIFPHRHFADPICDTLFRPTQRQGTLLVFPSNLKHHVTQHLSNNRRTTISGNLSVSFE